MSRSAPTHLDRYPAKMVGRLAAQLCREHINPEDELLDPFCGSGAILHAAAPLAAKVRGYDINPYAVLLSQVKSDGFEERRGDRLLDRITTYATESSYEFPIRLNNAQYWFTPKTLEKYGKLRHWCKQTSAERTREGRAILLALALTARRCSRADQRSPKPFISTRARNERYRRHYDPIREITFLFEGIKSFYANAVFRNVRVDRRDILSEIPRNEIGASSIVITSPPYMNAQDYYRNSKLELATLEGILPFRLQDIRHRFVGTERGDLSLGVTETCREWNLANIRSLPYMEANRPKLAAVIHRYIADMRAALSVIKASLCRGGSLVLVCGDNLIGGSEIQTWSILERIAQEAGFSFISRSGDEIARRHLAPKRMGHRGLIKKEIISHLRLK